MKNIKVYNKIAKVGLDMLGADYAVSAECDAPVGALVRSADLHDEVFPSSLLAIARAGAGTNNIPTDKCGEAGIVVFNTPSANANAVKELTLLGLLIASRRVVPAIEWAKTLKGNGAAVGSMVEKGKSQFCGPELLDKKLGVIGLGAIGVMVANAASHLGMSVYGYDPFLSLQNAWNLSRSINRANDIKEIFEKCDYISLHIPLNADTKNTINRDTLALMKDGVRIVNFARDGLVNSADMIAALESGKVASYVVDFPTDEMIGVDGVVAIPHLGASTPESENNCAIMAARQLADYIDNGNITNSVNFPNISMPKTPLARICVIHKNIPNMLTSITSIVAKDNVNIENLLNKSKGQLAYTMMDVEKCDTAAVCAHISALDGVIRVRVIE
ncbi:MAG: phosphoglycerate dehydrogenase [Clostridia bacterium]|nr:phosphoglycerate dehydrogenase [Clostridia bacterium]